MQINSKLAVDLTIEEERKKTAADETKCKNIQVGENEEALNIST